MVQREFAMRLCAKPGDELYCRLSVNTQLLSKADHLMKVSKNSFRPPPKVDSSVVRLEPKNPPPLVNFVEWDGLVRLCFNRKNRTLGAIFRTKSVLKLIADNLKTQRVLAGGMEPPPSQAAAATPMAMDDDDDDDGDGDGAAAAGGRDEALAGARGVVDRVLEESGYAEQRSAKMDLDDFMRLLAAFNAAGVHFTNGSPSSD